MSEKTNPTLNTQNYNELLITDLSELPPPDNIVRNISPWRKSVNQILIGLALDTITLSFLRLNYILPAIGLLLILLGLRTLRQENLSFRIAYCLSLIRSVFSIFCLILNATIWQNILYETPLFICLKYVMLFIFFGLIVCLRSGFHAVQRKTGITEGWGTPDSLLLWYGLLGMLALYQFSSTIIMIAMFIVYMFLLRNLARLSQLLDKSGYGITPAPVKLSSPLLISILSTAVVIGISAGYLFFNQYPMEWSAADTSEHAECKAARTKLIALGFPENILDDLTPADVSACGEAFQVLVNYSELIVNDNGYEVIENSSSSPSIGDIALTSIAVRLSADADHWKLIHHFRWLKKPPFYGTDALRLWPSYAYNESWSLSGDYSGRVLYTENGKIYTAPFHAMYAENIANSNPLYAPAATNYLAVFSFPEGKDNYRGYTAYDTISTGDLHGFKCAVNYVVQLGWVQYPVLTAADVTLWERDVFSFVQDILTLTPLPENSITLE